MVVVVVSLATTGSVNSGASVVDDSPSTSSQTPHKFLHCTMSAAPRTPLLHTSDEIDKQIRAVSTHPPPSPAEVVVVETDAAEVVTAVVVGVVSTWETLQVLQSTGHKCATVFLVAGFVQSRRSKSAHCTESVHRASGVDAVPLRTLENVRTFDASGMLSAFSLSIIWFNRTAASSATADGTPSSNIAVAANSVPFSCLFLLLADANSIRTISSRIKSVVSTIKLVNLMVTMSKSSSVNSFKTAPTKVKISVPVADVVMVVIVEDVNVDV